MAIVQAINGVAETYPVKPVTPRAALVDPVDSQAGKDPRHSAGDRTKLAAQQAYQEQTKQTQPPKPAILARDLITPPVVTLPSDATLLEAWKLMTHRSLRHLPTQFTARWLEWSRTRI